MQPRRPLKFASARWSGVLIAGGLPGFVWGGFQVPDHHRLAHFRDLARVYELPILGLAASLLVYLTLTRARFVAETWVTRAFSAAAVSCCYWYRIPSLVGYGRVATDRQLVDARAVLPYWLVEARAVSSTLFFVYWLLVRAPNQKSWVVRPAYAGRLSERVRPSSAKITDDRHEVPDAR